MLNVRNAPNNTPTIVLLQRTAISQFETPNRSVRQNRNVR
jgi:hypothetical protein